MDLISRRNFALSLIGLAGTVSGCAGKVPKGLAHRGPLPRPILVFPPLIDLKTRSLGGVETRARSEPNALRSRIEHDAVKALAKNGFQPTHVSLNTDPERVWSLIQLASYVMDADLLERRRGVDIPTRDDGLRLGDGARSLADFYGIEEGLFIAIKGSEADLLQWATESTAEWAFGFEPPTDPRRMLVARIDLWNGVIIKGRIAFDLDIDHPVQAGRHLNHIISDTRAPRRRMFRWFA